MSYYRICPDCGAHLDPGEVCDCRDAEKAHVSATNADEGGAEHVTHDVSVSYGITKEEKIQ